MFTTIPIISSVMITWFVCIEFPLSGNYYFYYFMIMININFFYKHYYYNYQIYQYVFLLVIFSIYYTLENLACHRIEN